MKTLKRIFPYMQIGLIIILILAFIYYYPIYHTLWHMAIIPFLLGLLISSSLYEAFSKVNN